MEDFEKMEYVEKLREKTGVTYEEARNALEACGWNMLDAVVYLEKLGKVRAPSSSSYYTKPPEDSKYVQQYNDYTNSQNAANKKTFSDHMNDFFKWCAEIFRKGNENYVCIEKRVNPPIKIPITVFVILLIVAFWAVVVLMVAGLFLGFRYSIQGKDVKNSGIDEVNEFMDKAADKATDIKEDIFNGGGNSDN